MTSTVERFASMDKNLLPRSFSRMLKILLSEQGY